MNRPGNSIGIVFVVLVLVFGAFMVGTLYRAECRQRATIDSPTLPADAREHAEEFCLDMGRIPVNTPEGISCTQEQ